MIGGFLVRSEAGVEILSVKTRWRVLHWRVVRQGPRLGLEGDRDNTFPDIRALVTHYRSGDRVGGHDMIIDYDKMLQEAVTSQHRRGQAEIKSTSTSKLLQVPKHLFAFLHKIL